MRLRRLFPRQVRKFHGARNDIRYLFPPLMFTVRTDATTLFCEGRLDQSGGVVLGRVLSDLLVSRPAHVTLDLSAVTYLSSAGVRSLLVALKTVKLAGGQLVLHGVTGEVEHVLQLSGLRSLFASA